MGRDFREGMMKPKLIDKAEQFEMQLINTKPGIVFCLMMILYMESLKYR